MLGFVVVSHSKDLAEAVIHLANEMKRYDFPHLRIPVTTLINPLCLFEISLFKYTSLPIFILVHLVTY